MGSLDNERLIAALAVLLLFGILYDLFVTWLGKQTQDHGYTAFLVVGGTIVTIAGLAWVAGLEVALVATILFAASGLPVIVGSMRRALQRRIAADRVLEESAQEAIRAH